MRAEILDDGARWFLRHGLPVGAVVRVVGRHSGVIEVRYGGLAAACAPQSLKPLDDEAIALLAPPQSTSPTF